MQLVEPQPLQTVQDAPSPFPPTLVLTDRFLPEQGGSITWLVQTYRRYAPGSVVMLAGQDPEVNAIGAHPATDAIDAGLPFQVERVPMAMADWDPTRPGAFRTYAQLVWRVQKICRQSHLQQLHCAKVLPEGLVAWCLSSFDAVPYLVYAHGEEIQTGLTSRKFRYLFPRIYNGATAIIANTNNTKMLLEEIGVQTHKIHVIHPGVEARAFRAVPDSVAHIRQRHQLGTRPVLLTVGRLQRRKGQDMVIQALPRIATTFPDIVYIIVGSGEEEAALRHLAQRVGMQDHVIFAGQVPESERAAYYAACDIFLMPNRQVGSDIEGFGMVFLEAGAAGKPVIGGQSGGTREAIVDNVTGVRVDGTNVNTIAQAVVSLLSDPDRRHKMGARGRRRVEAEFSWETIAEQTRCLALSLPKPVPQTEPEA